MGSGTGGGAQADQIALAGAGAGADGGKQAGGQEVRGVLLGALSSVRGAPQPGAPGLHGAGAGTDQTPLLAIAIAGALLVSILIGTQIERRRPEVLL